jgi:SnoaL-like domain
VRVSVDPARLADIEAIKQLKARYCLLLDAQEWDGLRELFTDECTFSVGTGDYDDPDAFVENLRENLTGESHVHVAAMPIVELTGPDSAPRAERGAAGHAQGPVRRARGALEAACGGVGDMTLVDGLLTTH